MSWQLFNAFFLLLINLQFRFFILFAAFQEFLTNLFKIRIFQGVTYTQLNHVVFSIQNLNTGVVKIAIFKKKSVDNVAP